MTLKDRGTRGGPLEPVIIAETDKKVIFVPGLTSVLTVGAHQGPITVPDTGLVITKPATATHIQFQAFVQNIRYTIDDSAASATKGFQLIPVTISTIPIPNSTLNIFPEATPGSTIQYQWVKAR